MKIVTKEFTLVGTPIELKQFLGLVTTQPTPVPPTVCDCNIWRGDTFIARGTFNTYTYVLETHPDHRFFTHEKLRIQIISSDGAAPLNVDLFVDTVEYPHNDVVVRVSLTTT